MSSVFCMFLCWQVCSTIAFGSFCICIWWEIVIALGILVSVWCVWGWMPGHVSILFGSGVSGSQRIGVLFIACTSVNCWLTAANLHLARGSNLFLAQKSALHNFVPIELHYLWGQCCLVAIGLVAPCMAVCSRLQANAVVTEPLGLELCAVATET